jgi:hypothetical protein
MRTRFAIALCLIAASASAQTIISKTIPLQKGQKIKMKFDYPELVKVSTWDKNEISFEGRVSINGGENDDAFKLDVSTSGSEVSLRNEITNMDAIPHRVTVTRDGEKMIFRNRAEWQKYKDEHGGQHSMMNEGVEMDIQLEIKVPKNVETYVESVYGLVEVKDFSGPITVEATYGGVDASLAETSLGELIAETNYGHIYSNLNVKFNNQNTREENFHTLVSVKPGNGPRYSFESKYGNVYLRKN